MEHSKTPWKIGAMESGQAAIDSADGKEVTGFIDMEDARRILACVNACAGIRTEALEHRVHMLAAEDDTISLMEAQLETERASLFAESQRKQQLEQQVAELVGALGGLLELHDNPAPFSGKTGDERMRMLENATAKRNAAIFSARAVIQKVRGGE